MATERTTINPQGVPAPIGAYSAVVQANCSRVAYLAGQVALNADGELVGAGDVAAQTKQVFQNLGAALEGIGASFSDVLEFTSYLVGREAVQPFIAARSEISPTLFPNGDYHANTLLVISGLVREDLLVEVKAVAALP